MPTMRDAFDPTADFGHKVMRVFLRSHVPKTVQTAGDSRFSARGERRAAD